MDDQEEAVVEQPQGDQGVIDDLPPEDEDIQETGPEETKSRPTWIITAVIGVAALLVGALLGFYIRPVVGPEAQAKKATASAEAVAVQTRSAQNQEMMKSIVGQVRHWKGDPNAPVSIIEWSDYQ